MVAVVMEQLILHLLIDGIHSALKRFEQSATPHDGIEFHLNLALREFLAYESHAEVILFESGTELRQFVGMMMCTRHPHGFHVVVYRQFGGSGSWVYDKCFHLFVIFRAVIRL